MSNTPGSDGKAPLRRWSTASYSASDGRAASALFPQGENGRGYTRAQNVSAQIPDAFKSLDRRRVQGRTPVKNRPVG
jgi:hypothetical protein